MSFPFFQLSAIMILYVFNPEHDLCLANGDGNFVPPQSALDFAKVCKGVMNTLYGDDAEVIVADEYAEWISRHPDVGLDGIIPWGWNLRLKHQLEKQQAPLLLLPDDEWLRHVRKLQHRTTILPLQSHAWSVTKEDELQELLAEHHNIVMKAPWSGAGRGLRWVTDAMTKNDVAWFVKTVALQRCVIVEVRHNVKYNFAIEYHISNHEVIQTGLSLFETQSGVFRHNRLLYDSEIRDMVGLDKGTETSFRSWLQLYVAPFYNGLLGIDLICNDKDELYVCEMNLRHTMGMVAHSYLEFHPECHGSIWQPPF